MKIIVRVISLVLGALMVIAGLFLVGSHQKAKTIALQRTPGIAGSWLDIEYEKYASEGVTATFGTGIDQEKRIVLAQHLDYSLTLLPQHLIDMLDGLEVTFKTKVSCGDEEKAGCFHKKSFTADVKIAEPIDKHKDRIARILIHEYAHAIDFRHTRFNPPVFSNLYKADQNRPTEYAGENAKEDFAESFEHFVFAPEKLRGCCAKRFAFIEHNVFDEEGLFKAMEEAKNPTTLERYALASSLVFLLLLAAAVVIDLAAFALKNERLHEIASVVIKVMLLFAAISLGLFLANLYINKTVEITITSLL